ncbi:DUF2914 domain-containing protein [Reichenbachiella agarivorans]|uniref:DUF2914 domain-containing protein n=1 Tax=Reichenbachiella agarivorans TaxID=2979464 RepID=A0ABY6CJW8_9BACT|nr:DUF2914 domain-containing protein [Reichenbachiella agarivorans]UXP30816.1 DUF2914 domain-containing protein [Reichenbachiella agarivorans]
MKQQHVENGMRKTLARFKDSAFRRFIGRHQKYAPVVFFIGGFIFDSLTLGRIDRLYDLFVLCSHMTCLTATLYLYNLAEDGKWKNTFLERFEVYFPLAIQFFFGALSSAYVVYFSRSVSLSRTVYFFIILVALLVANEFLKKRISNKYLQFGVYSFISFTFFAFMIPVFIKELSTAIFAYSGLISLGCTLVLIGLIYAMSPSTRAEIRKRKLIGIVLAVYGTIALFYYFKLIPPVPLALSNGIVAHSIQVENDQYLVTYETDEWHLFWRKHRLKFILKPHENVYIFSSIFAPTSLKKSIFHRWKRYNSETREWVLIEDIGFNITGGRDGGYRGYTYKNNLWNGTWQVEVLTEEGLVLGVIDFEIILSSTLQPKRLVMEKF